MPPHATWLHRLKKPFSRKTVLHVGNIAQNGYMNAATLNAEGWDCDVLCHDQYHFAATPAWQVLSSTGVTRAALGSDFFPNFFRFPQAFAGTPRWFAQGPQLTAIAYLWLKRRGLRPASDAGWARMQYQKLKIVASADPTAAYSRWTREEFDQALKDLDVHPVFLDELRLGRESEELQDALRGMFARLDGPEVARNLSMPLAPELIDATVKRYRQCLASPKLGTRAPDHEDLHLSTFMARLGPMRKDGRAIAFGLERLAPYSSAPPSVDGIAAEDAAWIAGVWPEWNALWAQYDYNILYAAPQFALQSGAPPYAAYEHGTIRSLPFEESTLGRTTRAGYLSASAVLVTNADYITAERKLEIDPHRLIWCPHGFDMTAADEFLAGEQRAARREARSVVCRLIAPARHDWCAGNAANDKGNDRIVHAAATLVREGASAFKVTFIDYGKDAEATRRLINELSVGAQFEWIEPQPQKALWSLYLSSHAVIDQFYIPAIGAIGVEALALGCRLITFDNGALARFFGEQPPLLPAETASEIAAQMRSVIDDPEDCLEIGARAAAWFRRRHGQHAILTAFRAAFDRIDADKKALRHQKVPRLHREKVS